MEEDVGIGRCLCTSSSTVENQKNELNGVEVRWAQKDPYISV